MRPATPIHFVCPSSRVWPELLQAEVADLDGPSLARVCTGTTDAFVLRVYYELRRSNVMCTLSDRTRPGAINIADVFQLGRRSRGLTDFVVLTRADGHLSALANFILRQDVHCDVAGSHDWVSLWVQPGLRPRNPARGGRLEVVTFKGLLSNLDPSFRQQSFRDALASLEVRLDLPDPGLPKDAKHWADYSNCDAVLAIRNLTHYDAGNKPPSKLINSWWADTPALLGPEPTYRALRRTELDYIEIRTPQDVIDALTRLKQSPELASRIRANGKERRSDHTDAHVMSRWIELLNGPIDAAFQRWQARPRSLRAAQILAAFAQEPRRKRQHRHRYLHGPRILDET